MNTTMIHTKASLRVLLVLAAAVIGLFAAPTAANAADLEIESFSARAVDLVSTSPEGEVVEEVAEAGVHPDLLVVDLKLGTYIGPSRGAEPTANLKNARVELPPGMVGNAEATPKCTMAELKKGTCPRDAVVGFHELEYNGGRGVSPPAMDFVYNIVPPEGIPARFAMNTLGSGQMVVFDMAVNSDGRYTIASNVTDIPESLQLIRSTLTLFGVPAALNGLGEWMGYFGNRGGGELIPMLTMGTECGPQKPVKISVNSWQRPDQWLDASYTPAAEMTGCERLSFDPTFSMRPDSSVAGAPAGFTARLEVPQSNALEGQQTPPLRRAEVTLPAGVTLSPTAAQGLGSCTDEQAALRSLAAPNCPEDSRVGNVRIETPLLAGPLTGSIYQGAPKSMNAQSGDMYRLFLIASGYGATIKQEGRITVDPLSGQIRASFDDAPRLPFSALDLEFRGGPRALLTNPSSCGTYAVEGELTPWSGPQARTGNSFTIDQGCGVASQFKPGFEAGTGSPIAGRFAPFMLRLTRPDGQQNLASVKTTLPEGLLAKLAGVPLCGDAPAATGNCPAASQVGKVVVATGAGTNPLYVPQAGKEATGLYLAGPYKGGPYSLVAKVPAQAGPFDLGTVAVRSAIHLDPGTAQVSVASDPLPQMLQGIPLAYREVRIDVSRERFTLNPTSCDPMKVEGTIASAAGASAAVSDRFQVADCGALAFKPKLALRFFGKTRRAAHPKLRATLTMPEGGANIEKAVVKMPKTELLDNAHIRTICTRVQYAAKACPEASIYGYAKAWTPLLDQPLEGPVYLRSSDHELPDLVASLDGAIHIDLPGRIDSVNARIRNTFWAVPDAPLSKFVLTMQGGKKGLLVNGTELCQAKPRAAVQFDGQNGKVSDSNPRVGIACPRR
jgi:hypothetical protein